VTNTTDQRNELDMSMPVVRQSQIANGIRVATLGIDPPRPSDVAVVNVRIPNGSALDGEMAGVARFTGAALTRGSDGRSFDDIAEELDGMGASISVSVGGEATDISAVSLAEDSDRVMSILAGMILRPDFPAREADVVRGQMLAGLRQALNSTRAEADREMRAAIYPKGHPYHQRSGGTEETLAQIDHDTLREFHEEHYKASRAIVSLAGGMDHEQSVNLIQRHLGNWSGETPIATVVDGITPESLLRKSKTLRGKSQSDISMGIPSVSRSHPDYYALTVANQVIGRFGLMGRLGESVRERQGMAYYTFSSLEAGKSVGLWTAKAGVAPQNVEGAIESIRHEVRGFIEGGPTEREFGDCIGSLLGALTIGLESSDSMASVAGDIVYYDLGDDFLRRYRSIIEGLTPESLQRAAAEHIAPDQLVVSVVGPVMEPA
jgi:zinc protease